MQIKMTSGGMKLLDHGTVFLAETNGGSQTEYYCG